MHDGAMLIAEHLKFDMSRRLDVLLEVDVGDAEGGLSLALGRLERVREFRRVFDDAHAAAAAAGRRLDDDGIADILGDLDGLVFALDWTVAPWQNRHAGFAHDAPRPRLV